jgi:glycine/D-amino acid oxidase-like deaminating enzyme
MIPYWDTPEAAVKAHDFFEAAGIVILALLVLAELAAYFYGHRHDALVKYAEAGRIQGLHDELAAAQEKMRHRQLSPNQRTLLVSRIPEYSWQSAEIIWVGHGEPEAYARELAKAFQEANVTVHVHTLGPFIPSAWGLLIVKTTNDVSDKLKALLDEAGVKSEVALTNDTLGAKDHPTLVVGSRDDM